MNSRINKWCLVSLLLFLTCIKLILPASAFGKQGVGRIQLQSDSNLIRYYGVASVNSNDPSETWRSAEQRAWAEGLTYLESHIKQVKQSKGLMPEISTEERLLIKQSTKSRGVTYFGDSRVKVALESDISQIARVK